MKTTDKQVGLTTPRFSRVWLAFGILFACIALHFCWKSICNWVPTINRVDTLLQIYSDRTFGFINHDGIEIVPCVWEETAQDLRNGVVRVAQNGKWGAIDKYGNLIVPCEWDAMYDFDEMGFAVVKRDDKYG